MHVCLSFYIYIYIYVCVCACVYIHTYIHAYIHTDIRRWRCSKCVCLYLSMCIDREKEKAKEKETERDTEREKVRQAQGNFSKAFGYEGKPRIRSICAMISSGNDAKFTSERSVMHSSVDLKLFPPGRPPSNKGSTVVGTVGPGLQFGFQGSRDQCQNSIPCNGVKERFGCVTFCCSQPP